MKCTVRFTVLAALLCAPAAFAQDAPPPMSPEQQAMMQAWEQASIPGAQHQQLAEHFVGTWDTTMTFWMDPSAPPMVETGTTVNTAVLGGRQIHMTFDGQFMGEAFEGVGYAGYDNVRGTYTNLWMDNMSTGIMLSDGEYDAATGTYTLHGAMADPMNPGTMTPIRETVRIVDADHHVMEMFEPRDGEDTMTMRIEYARVE